MRLSDRQKEAIRIIQENPGITARRFGELFWPDHVSQRKASNNSYGCQYGKAGWLMAGSYLGKLRKKGIIRNGFALISESGFHLTSKGEVLYETNRAFVSCEENMEVC